jgi:Hemerythrin HHE cation binding domain
MKRSPALVTLSHDHHQALSIAQKLRGATADTAGDARAAFVAYWDAHGRGHFRLEEEILLPAYASHGDSHHPLVARALCDHVAIRARADALLVDEARDPAVLHELGTCLADHVRLEERELFPPHRGRAPRRSSGRGRNRARPCRAPSRITARRRVGDEYRQEPKAQRRRAVGSRARSRWCRLSPLP